MSFKLIRYSGLRVNFIKSKFSNNIYKNLKYDEIVKKIYQYEIFNSNSLTEALKTFNYSTKEIIYDLPYLNKIWCRENNINENIIKNEDMLFYRQISKHKPNIIFFQHKPHVSEKILKKIKNDFDFIKLIIVHNGFYINPKELTGVDLVLCAFPNYKKKYEKLFNHTHVFYHYFNNKVLNNQKKSIKNIEVSFIGSSGYNLPYHYNRYFLLDYLFDKTELKCWIDEVQFISYSKKSKIIKLLKNLIYLQPKHIIGFQKHIHKIFSEVYEEKEILDTLNEKKISYKLTDKYRKRCFSPVYGTDMFNILLKSKISINSHMLKSNNEVGNMRMFEATGVGTCLFNDYGVNLKEIFKDGEEIITYKNKFDCVDKLNYFSKNSNEAKEIGLNGQKRTLKTHNQFNRANQLDEIITKIIFNK